MDGILSLISSNGFIVMNKYLLKELGINATIMLGELASEYEYWKERGELENDYFYSTAENIENNTTLKRTKQEQAIKTLLDLDLIDIQVKGVPAKRYFKINYKQVCRLLTNKNAENQQTSLQKTNKLECRKSATNNNKEIIINNNNKKNIYGEYKNVRLTKEEYEKLRTQYSNVNDLITYLDEYIEMKGYKAKSHYLCIKKWVVDAVRQHTPKKEETDAERIERMNKILYDSFKEV